MGEVCGSCGERERERERQTDKQTNAEFFFILKF